MEIVFWITLAVGVAVGAAQFFKNRARSRAEASAETRS